LMQPGPPPPMLGG